MAQVPSSARCWVGVGLILILISLGAGACTHFLTSWLTTGLTIDGVTVSVDLGLWKACVQAQDSSVAESDCKSIADLSGAGSGLDYVRGLDIGGLCASFLAIMFAFCGFAFTGCQISAAVLSLLGGGAMFGAVGYFVHDVDTNWTSIIAPSYSTAFYLACASGGAAMIASMLLFIASCLSCVPEKRFDEAAVKLIHVRQPTMA